MAPLLPTNEAKTIAGGSAVFGPYGRMDAWCGLSIDTRSSKVWSAANGGHGDYYGNEVCTINLLADSPVWAEWFAGSSGNVVNASGDPPATSATNARYSDGKPCSAHSYYGQQFMERQDRALRLGGSIAPYGAAFENVESFSVLSGARGWDPQGTFGFCLGGNNGGWTPSIGWCVTKNPLTEVIYTVTQPYIRRFTPWVSGVGGVWDILGRLPDELNSGGAGATAVDTRRNRLLWLLGDGPTDPYLCDLATGAWSVRQQASSSARDALRSATALALDALTGPRPTSSGMVYVPEIDAYLVRQAASGERVFRIDAETLAVTDLITTGGGGVPAGATFRAEQGVFNRWLYVPQLRGVVYFPKAGANAWFLRTH